MRAVIVSIILLFVAVSEANAHGQVWLSVEPNPSIIVVNQGPGQALQFDCTGQGQVHMDVTVHYTLADGGATGWSLDFYGNDGLVAASNLSVISQGFPDGVVTGLVPNSGGILLQDQIGNSLKVGGTGPGDFILETFSLDFVGCGTNVYAGIGHAEFGGNDPTPFGDYYENVQIGPNAYRPGYSLGGGLPSSAEPLPVIWYVGPEPSSIGLLAICTILIPRRRPQ